MTDIPPASNDFSGDFNLDSSGLMRILSLFRDKNQNADISGDARFHRLNDIELENLFRTSNLIKKIIRKYPEESKSVGYQIVNGDGKVIEENNEIILEAVKEASIFSRLYGKCYLKLLFNDNEIRPLKRGSDVIGFEIHFNIVKEGDFYIIDDEPVHHERVITFIGIRSYAKMAKPDDDDYADSAIQGMYNSFQDFMDNNASAKHLLQNLSYLSIGIDNLGSMTMSNEGQEKVFGRLTALNLNRNITRTVAYDKRTEELNFISQTISGVKEIIDEMKQIFVAESEYPAEEIFEESPTQKLGSGIQNQLVSRYLWARRVRNWVINNWLEYYKTIFERIRNMEGLKIEIPFIVDLTDDEKAEIQNKGATRTKTLIEAGVITPEEARTGYKDDKFTLNIELDEAAFAEMKKQKLEESQAALQKPSPALTEDADIIPDDKFWDSLATVTFNDLDDIAYEISPENQDIGGFLTLEQFTGAKRFLTLEEFINEL